MLLARRVRGRGPRGVGDGGGCDPCSIFSFSLPVCGVLPAAPGAGVSVDGGKTFTVYDTKLTCDARYGAFPSDSVWYVAAGKCMVWSQACCVCVPSPAVRPYYPVLQRWISLVVAERVLLCGAPAFCGAVAVVAASAARLHRVRLAH